ncbi:MAG: hypothetical protein QXV21_02235 [Candidatus Bathyarchaeia archaeon]
MFFTVSSFGQANVETLFENGVIRVPTDYPNITYALINCADGDTIIVEPGIYYESLIQVNKTVHIVGVNRENTVIDGGGTTAFIFKINVGNVVIENFTCRNTDLFYLDVAAIRVYNVTNVTIRDMIFTNVYVGVQLIRSNFTNLMFNQFLNTKYCGINIKTVSCNSSLFGNTFENITAVVISDVDSQFTKIYHNNFVNATLPFPSTTVFFDDGYPSGGNYWSDYVAQDMYNGPYQNVTGGDGILDVGYPSGDYSWDRYPLANPFLKIVITVGLKDFDVFVSANATLISYEFSVSAKTLTLTLESFEDGNCSCRVVIPKSLLSCDSLNEWVVLLDDEVLPYLPYEDGEFTYLYFVCAQFKPESVIQIVGNHAVPEFSVLAFLLISIVCCLVVFGIKIKYRWTR